MSTPANFNGQKPTIDPADTVMLLIDHQSGLFQTVKDMPMPELRGRAALAKIAKLSNLPVITSASVPQGPNGPMIPEIMQNAPHAKYVARKGEINAWDDADFVAAVKTTGKDSIIAGTITSVCMAFSAWRVHDGCKVFAVIDTLALIEDGRGDRSGSHCAGGRRSDGYGCHCLRAAKDLAQGRCAGMGANLHEDLSALPIAD